METGLVFVHRVQYGLERETERKKRYNIDNLLYSNARHEVDAKRGRLIYTREAPDVSGHRCRLAGDKRLYELLKTLV